MHLALQHARILEPKPQDGSRQQGVHARANRVWRQSAEAPGDAEVRRQVSGILHVRMLPQEAQEVRDGGRAEVS